MCVERQVAAEKPLPDGCLASLDSAPAASAAAAGPDPVCVALKRKILAEAAALTLPPAPLDALIDALGGTGAVAEMTGRKGRIVRVSASGSAAGGAGGDRYRYQARAAAAGAELDSLNVQEKKLFMDGKKLVAIISDAASTGA